MIALLARISTTVNCACKSWGRGLCSSKDAGLPSFPPAAFFDILDWINVLQSVNTRVTIEYYDHPIPLLDFLLFLPLYSVRK